METNEEIEIDIIDLLKWLLRYWYIYIIAAILGSSLGYGYAAYKNYIIKNTTHEEIIAECQETLTPKELEDVNTVVNDIKYAESQKKTLYYDLTNAPYSGDDLEDAIKRVDYWNARYNELKAKSNAFSKEQKAYYDALEYDPDKAPDFVGYFKSTILGCFIILFVITIVLSLVYILTPTIKTSGELSHIYNLPVFRELKGIENEEKMLSADLYITLNKKSLDKFAILYDQSYEKEKNISSQFCEMLKEKAKNAEFSAISPSSSPSELLKLSSCDSSIILVYLKKTHRAYISELLTYCAHSNCKVLGFIAI